MPEEITIHHATEPDLPELSALQARSMSALVSNVYTPSMKTAMLDSLRSWNVDLIVIGQLLVARRGSQIVACGGWSDADRHGAPLPEFQAGLPFVRNLYVDPDYARRGIGRRLLQEIMQMAGNELQLIALLNAVAMYEACGFTQVGQFIHEFSGIVRIPGVHMISTHHKKMIAPVQEPHHVCR
jgi:GNAT superfamily N-acetyltransferase